MKPGRMAIRPYEGREMFLVIKNHGECGDCPDRTRAHNDGTNLNSPVSTLVIFCLWYNISYAPILERKNP